MVRFIAYYDERKDQSITRKINQYIAIDGFSREAANYSDARVVFNCTNFGQFFLGASLYPAISSGRAGQEIRLLARGNGKGARREAWQRRTTA